MNRTGYLPAAILASLFLIVPCLPAEGKRPIAETDLYEFRWAADPRISPDGTQIAFTHVSVNAKHDGYETAIWIVSATGGPPPRPLTSGPSDTSPRWSPDGKSLAFLRALAKDGKTEPAQIYLLPMQGGEPRALTNIPRGAGGIVWSIDGNAMAFTSDALAKDFDSKDSASAKKEAEKSDVRVITRAAYRENGAGYADPERPGHIWTVAVPRPLIDPAEARQVTTGEFTESELVWSRDGSQIYFVSDRTRESYYEPPRPGIFRVAAVGGKIEKIAAIDGELRGISLAPDGRHLAFIGALNPGSTVDGVKVQHRSYSQTDLFITAAEPDATPRNLTGAYDFDIGAGVGGDQAPPRGSAPSTMFWSRDGRFVYVNSGEEGRSNLKRIDAETGKVDPITTGDRSVEAWSSTPDGTRAVVRISTPIDAGDLFTVETSSGTTSQITHLNEELFSRLNLTMPESIRYESFDGRKIQAWVQLPPDFQKDRKYPMILDIHGGPHSAYGYTFDHEFQWMAAKGYVVLYPNPRGSTTYGQDFGNIIQYHYPGDDFKDLMAGVDELVKRGWVDPNKLGVTGGSGGGVLTNWVIGHTDRFKAAVSQRSIADWSSFWYEADFTQFTSNWFRGAPWEQPADFKERSPITFIEKVHTPLMLIEGEADLRTPPGAGGEEMFRALKYLKRPVVMVRFPGESHELSRSGKPVHRVERLQHIVAWFDLYLLGRDTHVYDVR